MTTENYKKYIYLPSGGFFKYADHVWTSPITNRYILYRMDPNSFNSYFQNLFILLNHHVDGVDINELTLPDFYYLWTQFSVGELFKKDYTFLHEQCHKCGHINKVIVNYSELDFKQLSPFEILDEKESFSFEIDDNTIEISLKIRRVKDSITFSNYDFHLNNKNKGFLDKIVLYLATQIEYIKFNHEEYTDVKNYYKILQSLNKNIINFLYYKAIEINFNFGLQNFVKYKCKKCNTEHRAVIFNDLIFNEIAPNTYINYNRLLDEMTHLMQIARTPIINFKDLLDVPFKYSEIFTNALNGLDLKIGEVMI